MVVKKKEVLASTRVVESTVRPYDQLVRATHACILWDTDSEIMTNVKSLVHQCKPDAVAALALSTRNQMKLRTVPLVLARELARHKDLSKYPRLVSTLLVDLIQRADEMAKFLELYWSEKKQPISNQVKDGLAKAFSKFNEYELAKYRNGAKNVKTRDVLFMVHAKPSDVAGLAPYTKVYRKFLLENPIGAAKQFKAIRPNGATDGEMLFGKLVEDTLTTPDNWETELSSGKDKAETFTRLMAEKKLGALAFLRNLRNMHDSGVSKALVADYAKVVKVDKVLPFRFIAAARHVPAWESIIEPMMLRCVENLPKLKGKTVFIVDISGSMGNPLSSKSELNRLDTALALAILAREQCEDVAIYATAGSDSRLKHATALVPMARGFALAKAIKDMNNSLGGGGIFLTQVMDFVSKLEQSPDRILVLTDEQDCDTKCNPENAVAFGKHNYIINIASEKKTIEHNKFINITGWSEAILSYITVVES